MGLMTLNIAGQSNQPPSQSGWLALSLVHAEIHTFTLANFTTETTPPYSDPESDPLSEIKITSLPNEGVLKLLGVNVSLDDTITSSQLSLGQLTYESNAANTNGYSDSQMTFLVSDTGSGSFTSTPYQVTFTMIGNINQGPSQVGDGSADIDLGEVFVFTRASLTSQLNPPYEDPEGDAADKLVVDAVPTEGDLMLNGSLVAVDQIINFTDIDLGLFSYVNEKRGSGIDGFHFRISDTGSGGLFKG